MGNPEIETELLLRHARAQARSRLVNHGVQYRPAPRFDRWGRRDALALVIGAVGVAALALARKVWPGG